MYFEVLKFLFLFLCLGKNRVVLQDIYREIVLLLPLSCERKEKYYILVLIYLNPSLFFVLILNLEHGDRYRDYKKFIQQFRDGKSTDAARHATESLIQVYVIIVFNQAKCKFCFG